MDKIILDDKNFEAQIRTSLESIKNGQSTLVQILESLSEILTSSNIKVRKTGVAFLSRIVENKDVELTAEEIKIFAEFYSDRCRDHHSMISDILVAFRRLLTDSKTSSNVLIASLRIFFNEIQTQSQMLQDRRIIYQLLFTLLRQNLGVLVQEMGSEFPFGYLQAVESEKDPRNLRLIFDTWPIILTYFPLEPFTEDIFNVISCYFPIDFSSGNDSSLKEELVVGLRKCLGATVSFSFFLIPLILEKLDSDYNTAKMDALETLNFVLSLYNSSHLKSHLSELWKGLKNEVLGIRKTSLLESHLVYSTLEKCSKVLKQDSVLFEEWTNVIIWTDIKRHLRDSSFMTSVTSIINALHSPMISLEAFNELLSLLFVSSSNYKEVLSCLGSLSNDVPNSFESQNFISFILTSLNSEEEALVLSALECLSAGGLKMIKSLQDVDVIISRILTTSDFDESNLLQLLSIHHFEHLKTKLPELIESLSHSCRALSSLQFLSIINDEFARLILPQLLALDNLDIWPTINATWTQNPSIRRFMIEDCKLLEKCYKEKKPLELITAIFVFFEKETAFNVLEFEMKKHSDCPILLEAQICGLSSSTIESLATFTKQIFSKDLQVSFPLLKLRFNYINKCVFSEDLLKDLFSNSNLDEISWYIRALVLRGYKDLNTWLNYLLSFHTSEKFVESFQMILKHPSEDIPHHKLKVSCLYRQRFWNLTSPLLKSDFQNKASYLPALIIQLKGLPSHVITSEMKSLKMILVTALTQSDESEIVEVTLKTIKSLCSNDPSLLDVEDFIFHCIKIAKNGNLVSRLTACECIEIFTNSKESLVLVRLQPQIIRLLIPVLDDHKRIVRKAAVAARNAWCIL